MVKLIGKLVKADKLYPVDRDESINILEGISSFIKGALEEETPFLVDSEIMDKDGEVVVNFTARNISPSPSRNIPFHSFLYNFLGVVLRNISFKSNILLNNEEKERLSKRLKVFFLKVKLIKKTRLPEL